MQTVDQQMDTKELRRLRAEDRMLTRMEKREKDAETMIGELCREGKQVFYTNIRSSSGKLTGKTKEGSWYDLVDYLIRNNYA